jgi:hypothetical protein
MERAKDQSPRFCRSNWSSIPVGCLLIGYIGGYVAYRETHSLDLVPVCSLRIGSSLDEEITLCVIFDLDTLTGRAFYNAFRPLIVADKYLTKRDAFVFGGTARIGSHLEIETDL